MAADPHHHEPAHGHERSMTVIEDRDTGIGGVVAALLAAALIGFLIWLIAFSGVVFDRDTGDTDTGPTITNEQNVDEGDTGGTTGDTTDGDTTTNDGMTDTQ